MIGTSKRILAGRELTPIGLGCMSFSHGYKPSPDETTSLQILHRAIDVGYQHFDSARLYGLGKNEEILSQILKDRRDEMFITSKCGIEFDDGNRRIDCRPETIRRAVDKSLKTMGVDFIDLYYLHRRDFNTPIEDSVGTLAKLKSEGKIGGIGLSEMSAETVRKGHQEATITAVQSEYSLWTRNPEIAVLEACLEHNIAFVAFSPVARGVLAGGVKDPISIPEGDLRRKQPRFNDQNWPENYKFVKAFNKLASDANVTAAQLSLAWVLSRGEHVHVIPGTGSMAHMEENMETLSCNISEAIIEKAGELITHEKVSGHRYGESMRKAIDTEEFETC